MTATRRSRPRPGVTLIELLVVLIILGIAAGVSVIAVAPSRAGPDPAGMLPARIAGARQRALASGTRMTIRFDDSTGTHLLTALPDGGVVTDSCFHVDRLTGKLHARR
jgi:prepilin-type N-terminal cleavage/methylation domain-containing protein